MFRRELMLLKGLGLGAGGMYFLDARYGRSRRARLRDKIRHYIRQTRCALDKGQRDLVNRFHGLASRLRISARAPVDDDILAERIRSRLGMVASHPRSIHVSVEDGCVLFSGPILASEVDAVLARIANIPGIRGISNRFEVYSRPGSVPGLQGGSHRRPGRQFELLQRNWSPAARLVVGAAGGGLLLSSLRRRRPIRWLFELGGAALLARAITNMEFNRMLGINAGRRAIDIRKTLHVNAPVEKVFEFWSHYENFPRFMASVRDIQRLDQNRARWIVVGPAGMSIEFETLITEFVPNHILGWKTLPGTAVEHAGMVRFDADPAGGTRIDIRMSYNPPAGALGHVLASLLGADPKADLDVDLIRFKSLIEQGKTRVSGRGEVTQDQIPNSHTQNRQRESPPTKMAQPKGARVT